MRNPPLASINGLCTDKRVPSSTLAVLALLLAANWGVLTKEPFDPWQTRLQFDGALIASGQWWRLLTFNLVHWDRQHFLLNAAAFVGLGLLYERSFRPWYPLVLLGIALAVGLGLLLLSPPQVIARGLSGVVACQLALAVVIEARYVYSNRRDWWIVAIVAAILIIWLCCKWLSFPGTPYVVWWRE